MASPVADPIPAAAADVQDPLRAAIALVCEITKQHGFPGRITPDDFAIQRSAPGRTHATYVDQRYVITAMVFQDGHIAYSFGETHWINHGTRSAPAPTPPQPRAVDPDDEPPRGTCSQCGGSYQLRNDGRIRQHRGMFAGLSRAEGPWKCPGVGLPPLKGSQPLLQQIRTVSADA